MARTPRIVEDRREQIIDAAMHVFAHKGYTRATNKDIAREAGITSGLIYHYFANKEAVLKAVIEERSPLRLLGTIPPEMLEQPPEVFLPYMITAVLAVVEGEQFVQVIQVVLPELVHNQELAPNGVRAIQRITQFLRSYLDKQVELGVLRRVDTEMAAHLLVGSMMGIVLRRQIFHDPAVLQYTHAQIAESAIDTLLQGLFSR